MLTVLANNFKPKGTTWQIFTDFRAKITILTNYRFNKFAMTKDNYLRGLAKGNIHLHDILASVLKFFSSL